MKKENILIFKKGKLWWTRMNIPKDLKIL
jgi:hypothetical protein